MQKQDFVFVDVKKYDGSHTILSIESFFINKNTLSLKVASKT